MDWIAHYIVVCCASKSSNHRLLGSLLLCCVLFFFAVSNSNSLYNIHVTKKLIISHEIYFLYVNAIWPNQIKPIEIETKSNHHKKTATFGLCRENWRTEGIHGIRVKVGGPLKCSAQLLCASKSDVFFYAIHFFSLSFRMGPIRSDAAVGRCLCCRHDIFVSQTCAHFLHKSTSWAAASVTWTNDHRYYQILFHLYAGSVCIRMRFKSIAMVLCRFGEEKMLSLPCGHSGL